MYNKKWTKEELAVLESTNDLDTLERLLPNRDRGAIRSRIKKVAAAKIPWTEEELALLPEAKEFGSSILTSLVNKLPRHTRDGVYTKMASLGYRWVKDKEVITSDNPYPRHGKPWTQEELSLFPKEKGPVDEETLKKTQDLIPLRRPSAVKDKMRKEGYTFNSEEPLASVVQELSETDKYLLTLAYELGFRSDIQGVPTLRPATTPRGDYRAKLAKDFGLNENFNGRQLLYALNSKVTFLPWEISPPEEVLNATRKPEDVRAAAQALLVRLQEYLDV